MALLRSLLVVALISLAMARPGDLTVADQEGLLNEVPTTAGSTATATAARSLQGEQGAIIVTVNGDHMLDHSGGRGGDDNNDDKDGGSSGDFVAGQRFGACFEDGFAGGFSKGYKRGYIMALNMTGFIDPATTNVTALLEEIMS